MVPAARPVPVATYFPVFGLLITELFGPVNTKSAFRLPPFVLYRGAYGHSSTWDPPKADSFGGSE
jgi:hypothetical protein